MSLYELCQRHDCLGHATRRIVLRFDSGREKSEDLCKTHAERLWTAASLGLNGLNHVMAASMFPIRQGEA